MAIAAAWTLSKHQYYSAVTVLQYDQDPSAMARGSAGDPLVNEEWYNTQQFLLTSTDVAERAVRVLHLESDLDYLELRPGARPLHGAGDAVLRLKKRMSTRQIPNTRLAEVSVQDRDPKRAILISNAVAQAYLNKGMEARVARERQGRDWLAKEVEGSTMHLQSAELAYQAYFDRDSAQAVTVDEQLATTSAEIKGLEGVLAETRIKRVFASVRLTTLKSAQRDDPFDVHTTDVDANEQVKTLHAEYLRTTLRISELSALESTERASQPLTVEQRRLSTLHDQLRAVLVGMLQTAQGELTAAQTTETQLQTSLNQASQRARALQRSQLEFNRLDHARSEARARLMALRAHVAETDTGNAAETSRGHVIEPAKEATRHPRPSLALTLPAGGLGGIALAALLRRLMESRS